MSAFKYGDESKSTSSEATANKSRNKKGSSALSKDSSSASKYGLNTMPSLQMNLDFDEFYAERVANFEHERNIFNYYLTLLEPKRDDTYHLDWENRKLLEEARLTQLEYTQIEEKMFAIRKEMANNEREVTDCAQAQIVRREQITRLEELARPIEHDITYMIPEKFGLSARKIREQTITATSSNSSSSSPRKVMNKKKLSSGSLASAADEESGGGNLQSIWKNLKTGDLIQLEGRLHEETIRVSSALQDIHLAVREGIETRHLRTVLYADQHQTAIASARSLWQEHDTIDFQCFYAVAELLKLRYRIMIAQREEIEALEDLQKEKESFATQESNLRHEVMDDISHRKQLMKQEMEDVTKDFHRQLMDMTMKMDELRNERNSLVEMDSHISAKEETMFELLTMIKARYQKVHAHHLLDMEGYETEITMLEKREKQLLKMVQKKKAIERKKQQEQLANQQQQQTSQQPMVFDATQLDRLLFLHHHQQPSSPNSMREKENKELVSYHQNNSNSNQISRLKSIPEEGDDDYHQDQLQLKVASKVLGNNNTKKQKNCGSKKGNSSKKVLGNVARAAREEAAKQQQLQQLQEEQEEEGERVWTN